MLILIPRNQPLYFQSSSLIDMGLTEFNRLTVLKTYFKKQDPSIIMHRDYKKFLKQIF